MIKKKPAPKIIMYVVVTFLLAVALSLLTLLLTRVNIPKPEQSASTVKIVTKPITSQIDTYKVLVTNEIDRTATLSAEIKDSDSWFNVELPAIDFKISF
ncbi:MAG: hypothetical protein NT141_00625 [candidate division WWE3 bacterium]|nr:hypothetical protein [candidate division WWE3 bacterium]